MLNVLDAERRLDAEKAAQRRNGSPGDFAELVQLREQYTKLAHAAQEMVNERDQWARKAAEYYKLIEGILGERDQWKKMWFDDSAGHLQAQALLDQALEAGRKLLLSMLQRLNELRVEHGLRPLGLDLKEMDAAAKIVDGTKARIAQQTKDAPKDVDWAAKADAAKATEPPPDEPAIKDGEPGPAGLKDGDPGPAGLKDGAPSPTATADNKSPLGERDYADLTDLP
jgi:hypothetical protein